jgi:glycerophosphoryl diester phosphodiesterase
MMTMSSRNIFRYTVVLLSFFSCSRNQTTFQPPIDIGNVAFIPYTSMKPMEAIYDLASGSSELGTSFVCKVSKYRVSFFGNGGIFMILKYGLEQNDSSLKFAGFYRYSQDARQGLVNFALPKAEALAFLKTGDISNLVLNGNIENGHGGQTPIALKFSKQFSAYTKTTPFEIYAHHGVQTVANPPFAENSILGVLNDEDYGVNGLEFDVQLTRDKVPIMMHDGNIDIRLTQKSPISGNYDQYAFNFLYEYIRLIDGQRIASLEHCLRDFIDSTTMTYFWMDIKGDEGIFQALQPIVLNAQAHAKAVGRNVVIYADMPSNTVIEQFQSYPPYRADTSLKTMCELTLQDVIDNGCTRWGPRYSRGLLLSDVAQAHSMGIKVISWTLNDNALIADYIHRGQFDGFISDYPCFVVYYFYTMK